MSEFKSYPFRPPLYHGDSPRAKSKVSRNDDESRGREQQGWEAYRKWMMTTNGAPRSRRAPIDHSVYSWKGYHTWADRIRQSWKPEEN